VFACILASLRITWSGFWMMDPSFLRWFYHKMRQPRMTAESGIAKSQDFILGAETQFQLSRDFTDGCRTWDPKGHAYDVSIRFFPCRVYIDLSRRDTLRYEWPLIRFCHLVVCLVYCWWLEDEYNYGYVIMMIPVLLYLWRWHRPMFCLFMHILVYRCKHNICLDKNS
jgi:hypothetical protein